MMTRSKKKRSIGEDTSPPEMSNEKYATIAADDAVEVGEKVTMDQGGTSGGMDDDCQRMDYLQKAWLLGEKLIDLVDNDKGEFSGLGLRSVLDMAISRNIISVDPKMLNPVLWRTLPKELLLLVLARLPLPDINRQQSLSREWNRDMGTVHSVINRACDEASPGMVAIFSRHSTYRLAKPNFLVTICTPKSQYSYHLHPGGHNMHRNKWDDMDAFDGGLVCFVSTWRPCRSNPLCIVVVNILTGVRRKLPPLQYVYKVPPQMMHIEVDSETKCYRVVVVGKNINDRPRAEIYHSDTRQWTKITSPLGSIFGPAYSWQYSRYHSSFRCISPVQSLYDFVGGQLKHDEDGPSDKASVMTFWKDCKFVLHKTTSNGEISHAKGYCISKYHRLNNIRDWVQERLYLCSPFEDFLMEFHWFEWTLRACEGFLMVLRHTLLPRHCWLLDLASGEWRSLPNCIEGHENNFLMSRAFWNVIP